MRTWVEWDMNGMIRSGDVIMFLFKPVDFMSFMLSNSLGAMFGNLLLITIPGFVVLFGIFDTGFVPGWNIAFFALSLVGSCMLSFMLDFFIGVTCFWTSSIWGISAGKDLVVAFLSGALIPLPFYPDALLSALRFLPFTYMYNLPVSIMTSPVPDARRWATGLCVQAAWGVALYFAVRSYYSFSLKKLTVNGG
jgi:ABC-2 type transport system permease protein